MALIGLTVELPGIMTIHSRSGSRMQIVYNKTPVNHLEK